MRNYEYALCITHICTFFCHALPTDFKIRIVPIVKLVSTSVEDPCKRLGNPPTYIYIYNRLL